MFIMQEKADGISISLNYDNEGKLISAVTRGDGEVGENIFSNVIKMKNVLKQLPKDCKIRNLRGEILIFSEDFEKINYLLKLGKKKELKNPRNAATGISKRFDGQFSEYCTILYYESDGEFETEEERMMYFRRLGLKTIWWKLVKDEKEAEIEYNRYNETHRALTPYDIDGLVCKINLIEKQNELGYDASNNPIFSIAWKFPPLSVKTKILGIEANLGESDRITPVAILTPIKCGGVTISRASLHNVDIFSSLDLHYNDIVEVSRRNDVIPFLERNLTTNHGDNEKIKLPEFCPVCNTKTEISGAYLICPNPNCKGKELGNLNRWISALNIMDISEKTIELFYENGLIKEPADFYRINVEEIQELERMGEVSAQKIINNLMNNLSLTLATFIEGLNIPQFSRSRAELLIQNGIDSLEKMMNVKNEELVKIKGIEEKTASFIINGLKDKKEIIKNLLSYVTIQEIKNGTLKNKTFCVTGKLNKMDRDEFVQKVINNCGFYKSSIVKGLDYLVTNDTESGSGKNKKAKENGVKIINEEEFLKMIGE